MKQKQFKRRNNLMARTQRSIEERKKRTHLLCQIGGTVEKVLDRPLVEEDVMRLLNFLNQQERNGKYFTRAMEKCPDTGSEMEGTEND
jgi:hypothetical protein